MAVRRPDQAAAALRRDGSDQPTSRAASATAGAAAACMHEHAHYTRPQVPGEGRHSQLHGHGFSVPARGEETSKQDLNKRLAKGRKQRSTRSRARGDSRGETSRYTAERGFKQQMDESRWDLKLSNQIRVSLCAVCDTALPNDLLITS